MCMSASAFCSPGRLRAKTESMSADHNWRFARTAIFDRNGFVVTPIAPRCRPKSSSSDSAESCHHLVGVSLMTQSRYVPMDLLEVSVYLGAQLPGDVRRA